MIIKIPILPSEANPQDFAILLGAVIDGLGKSVVLRDDWMTRDRMLDICTRMIAQELGDADPAERDEQSNDRRRIV